MAAGPMRGYCPAHGRGRRARRQQAGAWPRCYTCSMLLQCWQCNIKSCANRCCVALSAIGGSLVRQVYSPMVVMPTCRVARSGWGWGCTWSCTWGATYRNRAYHISYRQGGCLAVTVCKLLMLLHTWSLTDGTVLQHLLQLQLWLLLLLMLAAVGNPSLPWLPYSRHCLTCHGGWWLHAPNCCSCHVVRTTVAWPALQALWSCDLAPCGMGDACQCLCRRTVRWGPSH